MDTFSIKTRLRPDYYEIAPIFGPSEVRRRASFLPFADATLLSRENIATYCAQVGSAGYEAYLDASDVLRSEALIRRLTRVGISLAVASIVGGPERIDVVPPVGRAEAFLDTTHAIVGDTYLSAPTIVALMLELSNLARLAPGDLAVEIGSGTGFHLACMARRHPRIRLVGLDLNAECQQAADTFLRRTLPSGTDVSLDVGPALHSPRIAAARYVYSTAGLRLEDLRLLAATMRPDAYWTVPRQITRAEYESEPASSWLRTTYSSYEEYRGGTWWTYLALETAKVIGTGERLVLDTMYDLRFVPLTSAQMRE